MQNLQRSELRALLGDLGQPIPKLNKAEKLKLTAMLKSAEGAKMEIEWIVRLCVATKSPLPLVEIDASTITRAVSPRDFLRSLGLLLTKDQVLRGSEVIKGLIPQVNSSNAKSVLSSLVRLLHKPRRKGHTTIDGYESGLRLDPATGVELMGAGSRIASLMLGGDERKAHKMRTGKNPKKPSDPLLDLAFEVLKRCECARVCAAGLELASALQRHLGASIVDEELERGELRWTYLVSTPTRLIPEVLTNGCLVDAEILWSRAQLLPQVKKAFEDAIRDMLTQRSDVPLASRQWAEKALGSKPTGDVGSIKVEAESDVNLERMGALLLASWDAKDEGPKARHLFEVFSGICRTAFGLSLVGQVGETVKFEPAYHQAAESSILLGRSARLLRPSVQWKEGLTVRVIVRGLVTPT